MRRGPDQSTVDLTDLDMWARAVPYAEFGRLRREAPVAWSADEGPGFLSGGRYADIVAASRDVATFSSSGGGSFEEPTDEDMAARRTIIDTDPPEHTKLRKVVASTFSQRGVAVYEHFITGLTEEGLRPRAGPSTSSTRWPRRSRSGCSRRSWACQRPTSTCSSTSATG